MSLHQKLFLRSRAVACIRFDPQTQVLEALWRNGKRETFRSASLTDFEHLCSAAAPGKALRSWAAGRTPEAAAPR